MAKNICQVLHVRSDSWQIGEQLYLFFHAFFGPIYIWFNFIEYAHYIDAFGQNLTNFTYDNANALGSKIYVHT